VGLGESGPRIRYRLPIGVDRAQAGLRIQSIDGATSFEVMMMVDLRPADYVTEMRRAFKMRIPIRGDLTELPAQILWRRLCRQISVAAVERRKSAA